MSYLLDVNVLVAWGWADHVDHERVARWLVSVLRPKRERLMTSAIPELGFVRVSVQRAGGQVTVTEAGETLAGMLEALGAQHAFLTDDQSATVWPEWCRAASRTTDAHLVALAGAHGVLLATLDTGIPGAFVVPQSGVPSTA